MIAITNRIPVARGQEAAFEERFARRARKVSEAPGFLRHEVLRPLPMRRDPERGWIEDDSLPAVYEVRTWWQSFEAFQAWTQTDAFAEAHRDPPPKEMFAGSHQLTVHEVFLGTGIDE